MLFPFWLKSKNAHTKNLIIEKRRALVVEGFKQFNYCMTLAVNIGVGRGNPTHGSGTFQSDLHFAKGCISLKLPPTIKTDHHEKVVLKRCMKHH